MPNPKTAAECIRVASPSDNTLKDMTSTPAWWAHCIGGSGVVNVYFFDELGEIAGSYQQLTVAAEVGIMGLPAIVFPVQGQPAQGVAEAYNDQAIWMEIIAVSGSLTWGLYGENRDYNGAATFLKSGTHRSYAFKNGESLRLGPAPGPKLGLNGAVEVDQVSEGSGHTLVAIVPSDSTILADCWVYVGVGGDVAVVATEDSAAVTLKNVPTGSLLPIRVTKVMATGTTATNLVAVR